jgi:novobiocin biosynthesis protein NovU/D-mycarose 3-C-methyltransferase
VLGIDPAHNIAAIANERGIPTVADFFGPAVVSRVVREHGQASVICGTNVFARRRPGDVHAGVDALMAPQGMFIFEVPYFANLLTSLEYDTILRAPVVRPR